MSRPGRKRRIFFLVAAVDMSQAHALGGKGTASSCWNDRHVRLYTHTSASAGMRPRHAFKNSSKQSIAVASPEQGPPRWASDSEMQGCKMTFVPAKTKQDALNRICDVLGLPRQDIGRGSTEPTEPLREACRQLGISDSGPKPTLGARIADFGGLPWNTTGPTDERCDSTMSPSGGGATITLVGLNRILEVIEARIGRESSGGNRFRGTTYRVAEPKEGHGERSIEIDLSELDRATALHAEVQNRAALILNEHDIEPLSPSTGDPQFDLAYYLDATLVVVEVKTVQAGNQRQQVRLGLGQSIDYRHRLTSESNQQVESLLLLSSSPEPSEVAFCSSVRVDVMSIDSFSDYLSTQIRE